MRKLKIKLYSREEGMGITTAQSVVINTALRPQELLAVLSPLTPYGVQVCRAKPYDGFIPLEDAIRWVRDSIITREVKVPIHTPKLTTVGLLPPLIQSVDPSFWKEEDYTFFHSEYLTLEGAQKVLGELGLDVRLAKSGAFYCHGEYHSDGTFLFKVEYITAYDKKVVRCEK